MQHSWLRATALSIGLALASSSAFAQQTAQPGVVMGPSNTPGVYIPQANNSVSNTNQEPVYQTNEARTGQPATPPTQFPGVGSTPGSQVGTARPGQTTPVPATPGTAAEQGYDPEGDALRARLAREAADRAANNNARQQGIKIKVPSSYNPVSEDAAATEWLFNWKQVLLSAGVNPNKIDFEASRRHKDDFAQWASRMVWALKGHDFQPSFDNGPVGRVCCNH